MQQKLEKFLDNRLRAQTADLREIIVVGMAVGEEIPYTHATAILRSEKDANLIICDYQAETESYWPAKPSGLRDKPLFKLGDLTDEYLVLSLFSIKKEKLEDLRREKLVRELKFIMTG